MGVHRRPVCKYTGAVVRLAGLLHLATHGSDGCTCSVDAETVDRPPRSACPPELTALHIREFGTSADGRIFVGERNG
ncbi:hypothetical protein ACFFX1_13265 [Dactylosporangium sucinum]|uniref:Uncharacterized protein n=1 Tax=Dactylosporangium sucinum TaxID=1424081 RepID=A0A917X605_9ACTN|nr:DUF3987 domain-containing protein [Dactylosporangium sucinum]GGM73891.1 hypothetical protein GCM10007977_089330 [Dactylosporangium sucinum]